jgi:PEP-CTERM motif
MLLDKRSMPKLDKRLAGYTLLGAAAFSVSGKAHADSITYMPSVDVAVNDPGTYSFLGSSFAGDITITASGDEISASVANGAMVVEDDYGTAALAYGTLIDPTSSSGWGSGGKMAENGDPFAAWPSDGSDAYLGFYFEGTGGPQAGWADISTTTDATDSSFTIDSYAYENDPNTPLFAGQTYYGEPAPTPEPSTLTLLALGCVGLLEARRRRRNHA